MQSFEARHYNKISINNCNFLGLDFSKQSLSKTYEPGSIQAYTSCINSISIFDSNLTATGLFIPKSTVVEARCSLLNGINLSEKDIDMKEYLDAYKTGDPSGYSCCSLCYTGINFLIRPKSITDFNRDKYISAIKNNQFIGCYINGKKFSLPIEKKEIAERIKKAYLDMKSEKFASVDEQFKPYEKALKKTK